MTLHMIRLSHALPALPFLVLPLLMGCGAKAEDGALDEEEQALGEALWGEIEGYDGWSQLDPWLGEQASADGTHGATVQIWLNDAAAALITAVAGGDMPDGAAIVKEGYDDDGELQAITAMLKEGGGWSWGRFDADGAVSSAGDSAESSCAGCHSSGQDGLRAFTW